MSEEITISLITCTHNPSDDILDGLSKSIRELICPEDIKKEILIIDNNSTEPISENSIVKDWIENQNDVRIVEEPSPGLAKARYRGLVEAKGSHIIFFDDDNRPYRDYLIVVSNIIKEYPFVGVWGPGNVFVEWEKGGDTDFQTKFKHVYQEHHQDKVTYALDFISPKTMPYGTGMILNKIVADIYLQWYSQEKRSTTDRIGKSLVSGGDNQICWLAMDNGWAIGRHPDLQLTHYITADKSNWNYLGRLLYSIHSSYSGALKEALPEKYKTYLPSSPRLLGYLFYHFIAWFTKRKKMPLKIYMSKHLGQPAGAWAAENVEPPFWFRKITNYFYKN